MKKRRGLGVAPYCLPDSSISISDKVTHGQMQEELDRLRAAITYLANCLGSNVLGQQDAKYLSDKLIPPSERLT